jgi:hypothetical protein
MENYELILFYIQKYIEKEPYLNIDNFQYLKEKKISVLI